MLAAIASAARSMKPDGSPPAWESGCPPPVATRVGWMILARRAVGGGPSPMQAASYASVCARASRAGQNGEPLAPSMSSSEDPTVRMKSSTTSPRRPSASNLSTSGTSPRFQCGPSSSMLYGTSYTASLSIERPAAAASSARPPPDEAPNTWADPPASAMSASRSSTSRSTAYGGVSPLSPRPHRSYWYTGELRGKQTNKAVERAQL